MKDQNGTIHQFSFDALGRRTADTASSLGDDIDDAVRRIGFSYGVKSMVSKVTSFSNTAGTSAVGQVVFDYNDLGLLVEEFQDHDSVKDGNTPSVEYAYDDTAVSGELTKGMRPTMLTYPNGRKLHFVYTGGVADSLGRVLGLSEDNGSGSPGGSLVRYDYLGLSQIVKARYAQPAIRMDLDHGTAGDFDGLDAFGRVKDLRWIDYSGGPTDVVRIKHGYDRASNRKYREDVVAATNSVDQDEFYTYDGVNRLTNFDLGNLTAYTPPAQPTGISGTPAKQEDFGLDATGNWTDFTQKTGATTDLDQDRTHNAANEVTDIGSTTGTDWADPTHDRAGNMTLVPKPSDLENGYTLTYDAWNRLVKVEDGETTVAQYKYDGLNRRIVKTVSGTARHFYYSQRWQVLEERLDASTDADRQYVWGLRYVDDLVLRDRDSDDDSETGALGIADSGLDERLYALQDPNFNVVALAETDGTIAERYRYTAYGKLTALNPNFSAPYTGTDHDWHYLYTGRRIDDETGLLQYRNRYYHAEMGRFVSRDPIGYWAGSPNLHEYVNGRATVATDRWGLLPCLCDCDNVTVAANDVVNKIFRRKIRAVALNAGGSQAKFRKDLSISLIQEGSGKLTTGISNAIEAELEKGLPGVKPSELIGQPKFLKRLTSTVCIKIRCNGKDHCIGLDKIGHFVEEGLIYYQIKYDMGLGATKGHEYALAWGLWTEGQKPEGLTPAMWDFLYKETIEYYSAGEEGLSTLVGEKWWATFTDNALIRKLDWRGTGSPADVNANISGLMFWEDLLRNHDGEKFMFDICNYRVESWDHLNPEFENTGETRRFSTAPSRPTG